MNGEEMRGVRRVGRRRCEEDRLPRSLYTPRLNLNLLALPLLSRVPTVHYFTAQPRNAGRTRTVCIQSQEQFFVVTLYVPNSGEGLVRLKYRTKEWDPQLQSYVKALGKEKPVVVNGDLNVAHL